MKKMRSLPPKIRVQEPRGVLEIRVDQLQNTANQTLPKIKFVNFQWWGLDERDLFPIGTGRTAEYAIVSSKERFHDYLRDAGRLYVEAVGHEGNTLGFAVIERLEQIVHHGGISTEEVEVFNKDGQVIGHLRCLFMFEETPMKRKKVTFLGTNVDEEDLEPDYDEVASEASHMFHEFDPEENVPVEHNTKKSVPTWNLSTERLKFISRVKSLTVNVRQITFNPAVMQHLDTFNVPKASRAKPSFLLKYQLPNETNPITFCASKQSRTIGGYRKVSNDLNFEGQSDHLVRFNTEVLDSYWISKLTFQLFIRHLGQRVPLVIGESNIGLKHLLINSKYSTGREMKLPLYASSKLHKHLEKHYPEEIIGDIHLTFNFKGSEEPLKVELKSKRVEQPKPVRSSLNESVPNIGKKYPLLLCLLRVNEGRGFAPDSRLYLACRFFSKTEKVSSSIQFSNGSRPRFEFQHIAPMESSYENLDSVCKENNLVIEVWSFMEPNSKMLGIATIPLHQLFTAFQEPALREEYMNSELPLVAFNDWFIVRDVLNQGKVQGEIKVLLACGMGKQIYNLTMKSDENEKELVCDSQDIGDRRDQPQTLMELEDDVVRDNKVPFSISIVEGRNFPMISSEFTNGQREPPTTFVTFSNENQTLASNISKSCTPSWNFSEKINLPLDMLTDRKRQLIIKVWHRGKESNDLLLGFAAIDLSIILHDSFIKVEGWYNLMDYLQRCRGQIKVKITPLIELAKLKEQLCPRRETEEIITDKYYEPSPSAPKPILQDNLKRPHNFWNPPTIALQTDDTRSTLQLRLNELDCISKRLQTKSNVEVEDETNGDQELEKLRKRLESQLQLMQESLKPSANDINDEADDATYDISQSSQDDIRPRMAPDGGNPAEPEISTKDKPTRS